MLKLPDGSVSIIFNTWRCFLLQVECRDNLDDQNHLTWTLAHKLPQAATQQSHAEDMQRKVPESFCSYRLELFFIRPLFLPQVKLLGALGSGQVLLVYDCPQPCPTAPVLPLSTAVKVSSGCSCFTWLHVQVAQSMPHLMVQSLHIRQQNLFPTENPGVQFLMRNSPLGFEIKQ